MLLSRRMTCPSRRAGSPTRMCPTFIVRFTSPKSRMTVTPRAVAYDNLEFFAKPDGIYNNDNTKVQLRGINWFGCETEMFCPHAMWKQSMTSLCDTLKNNDFNAVRLTFSAEFALKMDDIRCEPNSFNPDMNDLTAGEMLDHVVDECRKRGILVMLCMYCLDHKCPGQGCEVIPELWCDEDKYKESTIIEAWKRIAKRYVDKPHVFAFDLKNEPHDSAAWGNGDYKTDWAKAIERIGNAIHEVNPKALIFAEGIQKRNDGSCTFWGGCLDGLRRYVPRLNKNDKLVFSPHVYGPNQNAEMDRALFSGPDFPDNMPSIWDKDWGFCAKERIGPLVVGEWGGRDEVGSKSHVWHESLVQYLTGLGCTSNFYWALNANAGDETRGLLTDDWTGGWRTVDQNKMQHIKKLCPQPTRMDFATS